MSECGWIDYDADSETLRLSAETDVLLSVAELLARMEYVGAEIRELTALPGLEVRSGVKLILDPHIKADILRTESENPPCWRLSFSEEGWLEAAEKVAAVARSPEPGHCSIQVIGNNAVTILVAKGEHDNEGRPLPES